MVLQLTPTHGLAHPSYTKSHLLYELDNLRVWICDSVSHGSCWVQDQNELCSRENLGYATECLCDLFGQFLMVRYSLVYSAVSNLSRVSAS